LSYLPKLAGFVCQRAYETPAGGLFRCWRFRCRFDGIGERHGIAEPRDRREEEVPPLPYFGGQAIGA